MKRAPSLTLATLNVLLIATTAISVLVLIPRVSCQNYANWFWRGYWGVALLSFLAFVMIPLVTLGFVVLDGFRGLWNQGLLAAAISSVLILVPVLWGFFARPLALDVEQRVNLAWAETLDPMDSFAARFPETPISDGALKLEAAAARIGIELRDEGAHPAKADQEAFEAVWKRATAYVSSQLERMDETIDAPPEEVSAWLLAPLIHSSCAPSQGLGCIGGLQRVVRRDRTRPGGWSWFSSPPV